MGPEKPEVRRRLSSLSRRAALARTEHIYKAEKFSDHAPITIGYDLTL